MMEPDNPGIPVKKRPLFLTLISLFSFVFYGIMAILFLMMAYYGDHITNVVNIYLPEKHSPEIPLLTISVTGFLLHGIAFAGIVIIWNIRKTGYYLFAIPSLIIACIHLLLPGISWLFTITYIILIVLFGLFYRNLR